MAASCCSCPSSNVQEPSSSLPFICLVPRNGSQKQGPAGSSVKPDSTSAKSDIQLLDQDYIKKHFNLPQRALYLDSFRRPMITFPMTQEEVGHNFNMARKNKINQQILDGTVNASEAITAPSIFPYAKSEAEKRKEAEDDEEIIYILQLPDLEFKCPDHNQVIKTPRFIWHSCKKAQKGKAEIKRGGGPNNKPKPWLLSRHTDFDLLSQW